MRKVKVVPVEGGWLVQCEAIMPTAYRSGAAAEKKAAELGHLLARQDPAEILIHDRRGTLVGSRTIGPNTPYPSGSTVRRG